MQDKGDKGQEGQEKKGKGKQKKDELTTKMAATQITTSEVQAGPSAAKRNIVYVDQGTGGTFKFEADEEGVCQSILLNGEATEMKHVGTDGCIATVAVYFEISGNRFFCAHLDFWHKSGEKDIMVLPKLTETQAEIMKADLKTRLAEHAARHGWTAKDVDLTTVQMVSPYPHSVVSDTIAAGIREFVTAGKKAAPKPKFGIQWGLWVQPGREPKCLWYSRDPKYANRVEHVEDTFVKCIAVLPRGEWRYSCDKKWELKAVPDRGPGVEILRREPRELEEVPKDAPRITILKREPQAPSEPSSTDPKDLQKMIQKGRR